MSEKKQNTGVKKTVYVLENHTRCRNFLFAKGARFEATEAEIAEMNADSNNPKVQVLD